MLNIERRKKTQEPNNKRQISLKSKNEVRSERRIVYRELPNLGCEQEVLIHFHISTTTAV